MPYETPTLTELRARTANNLARSTGGDAQTPGTGFTEIANVNAGIAHGLYGQLAWLANQLFVDTQDDDVFLARAAERGIFQIPAAFGTGTVVATGNEGAVIPELSVLQHTDGRQYRSTAEATITGGNAVIDVIALEAGVNGNLNADQLAFINPVIGVDGDVTSATVSGGADIEPIARVKERYKDDLRLPPLGGAKHDYVKWAREASVDVTRAWPFEHENGIGSMVLRFVTEDLADPIPPASIINVVQNYIDAVRPGGMRNFTAEAPQRRVIDITFNSIVPNTEAVQQAIEAALRDLFRRDSRPGGTILISTIRESISGASGEQDYSINLNSDIVLADDEFAVLGTITWPGQ